MKKMKRLLISMFMIIICSIGITYSYACTNRNNTGIDTTTVEILDSNQLKQIQLDSIKGELVLIVNDYVKNQAPDCHDSIPYYLVEHALNYDIDLCFMMGQTQLETNFGTLGAGRETSKRSLFGVGIYPGTKHKGYPNYDIAVEEYCKLLKRLYLVKGRDEHFLMKNYINIAGNRYAGAGEYEVHLRYAYNVIKKKTDIEQLQTNYKFVESSIVL
jgi:hypothetical protein